VLLDKGHTYRDISRQLNLSVQTIADVKFNRVVEPNQDLLDRVKRTELAELTVIGAKARGQINRLLDDGQTKLIETVACLDRTFQQRQLLEGKPTIRIGGDLTDTVLDQQIAQLEQQVQQLEQAEDGSYQVTTGSGQVQDSHSTRAATDLPDVDSPPTMNDINDIG